MTAALHGAREISFAAIAATLSIAAIFIPVAFMQGAIGRFFFQFGITVHASPCCCRWSISLTHHADAVLAVPDRAADAAGRCPRPYGGLLGPVLTRRRRGLLVRRSLGPRAAAAAAR